MQIIISFTIYMIIATIILFNILFNPNLQIGRINDKTGEEESLSNLEIIIFCLLWIIIIPIILIKGRFYDE